MNEDGAGAGAGEKFHSPPAGSLKAAPLSGLTLLNTRERSGARDLTERLTKLGGNVIERPMLAFVPPHSWQPFDDRLEKLAEGDWLVFTSTTALGFVMERLAELGIPAERLARARIASVGQATARAIKEAGFEVALLPQEKFQAEGLLEEMLIRLKAGEKVWLPRAEKAREVLTGGLRAHGIEVDVTPVYRTILPDGGLGDALEILLAGGLDWITFTSSSTVTHFFQMLSDASIDPAGLKWPKVACLGTITAETAQAKGLKVDVIPSRQDLDGLVKALVAYVEMNNPG